MTGVGMSSKQDECDPEEEDQNGQGYRTSKGGNLNEYIESIRRKKEKGRIKKKERKGEKRGKQQQIKVS